MGRNMDFKPTQESAAMIETRLRSFLPRRVVDSSSSLLFFSSPLLFHSIPQLYPLLSQINSLPPAPDPRGGGGR